MSHLARFLLLETPQALVELMSNSVVQTGGLKTKNYGMPQMLKFERQHEMFSAKKGEGVVPIYSLTDANPSDASFKSYICDYSDSAISYQILDKDADFCFTWTMNGCTFGIGSPTEQGAVLVSHGNAKGIVDKDSTQSDTQAAIAKGFHGPGTTLLEPATYRPPDSRQIATTFGYRDGTGWHFCYQSYKPVGGGKYELLGVFPIEAGTTNL